MKLYIDTADRERIAIALDGERFEAKSKEGASQRLLPFIDEVLQKKGKKLGDISEIEVNPGPGSFTGLRVGVAVAQALAWVLQVPIKGTKIKY